MPPHQTNLTSENGRDVAGLGLDLSIALVKGAMDQALTVARPDAAVAAAARRNAASDKDAAGPPGATARSGWRLFERYWRVLQESRRHRRLRTSLQDLNERQLLDIGLSHGDIDCIAAHRAIEKLRDGTRYRWLLRGVM